MAQSFLIFDFGEDETAAQHARHRIDGWKQAFRLDKKMQLKFDRKEAEAAGAPAKSSEKAAGGGSKAKNSKKTSDAADTPEEKPAASADISLIIRLDFSDHEKLSHHSWLNRIPSEEPFKAASSRIVRSGDPEFGATAERFDSLD